MSRTLLDLLAKDRLISPQQHAVGLEEMKIGKHPVKSLIEQKVISDQKLVLYLSQKFGLPSINLSKFKINPDVAKLIPPEVARKCQAIPIQSNATSLVVAVWDPSDLARVDDIKFRVRQNVEIVLTALTSFEAALEVAYGGNAQVAVALDSLLREKSKNTIESGSDGGVEIDIVQVHDMDAGSSEVDAPVITLVNGIFAEAIKKGASDIHVEPYEKRFRVRLRIDGSLYEVAQIPSDIRRKVIARFKILARLDIGETRVPQDGRIKLKFSGKEVDFRVSSMPTLFGEKIVLRMLSKGNLQLDLEKLGFEKQQLEVFRKGIYHPFGMVLVTGPTGSGKTTTLYSALQELNKVTDNISTAEDPVEYNLDGVNQVQVNKEVGLTFASVLRTLLRQDPDVILVGEIRDYETAEVAIQAALTGHLVLSTLHTNDAPSTVVRLMNMGVEPFLVSASLNTVVAQRLVRKICEKCKADFPIQKDQLIKLGVPENLLSQFKSMKGSGCPSCQNSGYKGRIAIYEIMDFTPEIKEMVLKGATVAELRKKSIEDGMRTLRDSGLNKVQLGQTTLEEALTSTSEN